jgi:hypothetical protein
MLHQVARGARSGSSARPEVYPASGASRALRAPQSEDLELARPCEVELHVSDVQRTAAAISGLTSVRERDRE